MNLDQILKALQAAAILSQSLSGLASELREALSSNDKAKLDEALKELSASNDALHQRIQAKLRG